MLDHYVIKDKKKLRCGYTTGSCAAAATKAATQMLLSGEKLEVVGLTTPSGIKLLLDVEEVRWQKESVTCAIRKDAGDDPDVTHGMLVFATVSKREAGIVIDGGIGVGRVTKPGLDQPIGAAAINSTPRRMIQEAIEAICLEHAYTGGIEVILTLPEGVERAKKTFNPRLGIEGGLSILGTTGIVEPMSEKALIETIHIEMRQQVEQGKKNLIVTPGNYGLNYLKSTYEIEPDACVKCSNYIGETIDLASTLGVETLLVVGHIGKLVKVGAGVMNTHSKWADARMETLASCVLLAEGEGVLAKAILQANTTDEAIGLLQKHHFLEQTMVILMEKISTHLNYRAGTGLRIGAIVFSNQVGILGMTKEAAEQLAVLKGSE